MPARAPTPVETAVRSIPPIEPRPLPVSLFVGLGHLRFFGWKTADVTEKLFRTQPILDWLAYSAEYADGRVFAADTVTTGVIGCMTEVAKKRTERPCE